MITRIAGSDRAARRRATAIIIATALAFAGIGAATPAAAADSTVTDATGLIGAVGWPATDGDTVTLGSDITITDDVLSVAHSITLDLAGHTLTTKNITVSGAKTLTVADSGTTGTLNANAGSFYAGIAITGSTLIVDGGTINATGGSSGAGIGGSQALSGGTVLVNGGTVRATGGHNSAGIGGGANGLGGTTTITGGTVTASGGFAGAGIGGGFNGNGGSTTISGGAVTATSGRDAAGIGGGTGGGGGVGGAGGNTIITGGIVTAAAGGTDGLGAGIGGGKGAAGGTTVIAAGADVTASSVKGSAIGTNAASSSGTLEVGGILRLPTGSEFMLALNFEVHVIDGGMITGAGTISGGGLVINEGTITTTSSASNLEGHNYLVTFDHNYPGAAASPTVRVFAATLAAGQRNLPPDAVRAGETFLGWNTAADGSGTAFTPVTTISGSLTVYAHWAAADSLVVASATVIAGAVHAFTAEAFDGGISLGDVTAGVTFASSMGSDLVTGNSIRFTEAGIRTITATLTSDPTVTTTATVTVNAGVPVSITLTASVAGPNAGDVVTFTASAADSVDNTFDATADVVFTSSNASDQVTGNSIRFTETGIRTITATLTSDPTLTATAAVTVAPAATTAITVTPSATTANAGDAITLTTAGVDAHGNSFDATPGAAFTSSEASDAITGNSIRFTKAGSRTITATLASDPTLTATTTVTVAAGAASSLTVTLSDSSPEAGTSITLTAAAADAFGNLVDVDAASVFTSSNGTDDVTGNSISLTQAGARTITATLASDPTVTTTATVIVQAAAATGTTVTAGAAAVRQGETITLTVTAVDAHGNTFDVTADTVFTSDVATDVVTGNSIRFPTASPHVITAATTLGNGTFTSTVTVNVTPAAAPAPSASSSAAMPVTGYDAGTLPLTASILMLLGLCVLTARRATS